MLNIEEFIRKNASTLAAEEPRLGHEQRFLTKLKAEQSRNQRRKIQSLVFRVAATLLLLVSIVWLVFEPAKTTIASNATKISSIKLPLDLTETLDYYNQKALAEANNISKESHSTSETDRVQKFAQKQIEKLDAQLLSIEKEYVKNPGNEAVRAALVNTQRKKSEIIDNISTQTNMAAKGFRVGEPFTQF